MKTEIQSHGGYSLATEVRKVYLEGQVDYSLEPLVRVDSQGIPLGNIESGDSVVFCCRRGEREIELTEAFTETQFPYFTRPELNNLYFVILTLYHEKFKDLPVAFAPFKTQDTLGEIISKANLSQFHCAESEKYAHVTFFFNGGNNQPFPGEVDIRIPSPKGIPFDQIPQLSLEQVSQRVLEGIEQKFDFIVTNFANGDVIGHTSNREAKIKCAEFVDNALNQVVESALEKDYVVLVTADHGNLEELITTDGKPHVAHTTNLVPFILIDPRPESPYQLKNGKLADIAPTILQLMSISAPPAVSGASLLGSPVFCEPRRVLLIILDGWGIGNEDDTNPIFIANTPYWDQLIKNHPPVFLQASGEAVGLQAGKTGNSEAGHMNIGAGRVVPQDDVRLDQAMKDGSFYTNEIFLKAMEHVKQQKSKLHLIALLTDKSSHGSIDYPLAMLKIARDNGIEDVFIHVIFDGRSTEPGSAPALLEKLEKSISEIGVGQIVSGVGRGIALDRDGNYAKIKRTFDSLVLGSGRTFFGEEIL
ncbi:MAG: phosphoglycerate mutase (2,3-diphosphoglycerate-independent) [Chloroflexi bacterium HGW-Chloroflexi-10]|nr:MAG: phosphoglycerate mutase (2,3-diphosphoglycerate-independent) [Chloroflexi bacterium HGW-Chloroflexi-10]